MSTPNTQNAGAVTGTTPPIVSASDLTDVWKQATSMQMHFNNMCLDIRKTAVGILGVLLGAAALAFRFGGDVLVGQRPVSVSALFALTGILVWVSFYLMDRYWYHVLLRASVAYCEEVAEPALTSMLGTSVDLSKRLTDANRRHGITGSMKIHVFYLSILVALAIASYLLLSGHVSALPPSAGS